MKNKSKHIPYTEEELATEIWKDIPKHTPYKASNLGRVSHTSKGILKTRINLDGYVDVSMKVGNKQVLQRTHRMVGFTFIPNPDNKETVNHKDGNKQNNRDWNLEWNTRQENISHAVESGLWSNNVIVDVLDLDTKTTTTYMSMRRLAKAIGVDPYTVNGHIKHSEEYPVLGRYVIKLRDMSKLDPIDTSGKPAVKIWCYDVLTKEWTQYNSIISANYHTLTSQVYISVRLRKYKYLLFNGYYYMYKKDDKVIKQHLDLESIKKARQLRISKPYHKTDQEYILYDYSTGTEKQYKTIADVVEYLNTVEPLEYQLTDSHVGSTLGRINTYGRTWLIKGYGIKSTKHRMEWYPYCESDIICYRYNKDKKNAVYEIGNTKEYIIGNDSLVKYLKLDMTRGMLYNIVHKYGIAELISRSETPNIKLRMLKKH